jgi:hypothetical protein
MVKRAKVSTEDVFLTADGVATRPAIKELKNAKIDPRLAHHWRRPHS